MPIIVRSLALCKCISLNRAAIKTITTPNPTSILNTLFIDFGLLLKKKECRQKLLGTIYDHIKIINHLNLFKLTRPKLLTAALFFLYPSRACWRGRQTTERCNHEAEVSYPSDIFWIFFAMIVGLLRAMEVNY